MTKLNPNNKKTKQEIWNKDFVCNYCGSHAIPSHKAGCRFGVSTYNKKKVQPLQVNEKIGGWEEQDLDKEIETMFFKIFDLREFPTMDLRWREYELLKLKMIEIFKSFISSQLTLAEERGRREAYDEAHNKLVEFAIEGEKTSDELKGLELYCKMLDFFTLKENK